MNQDTKVNCVVINRGLIVNKDTTMMQTKYSHWMDGKGF